MATEWSEERDGMAILEHLKKKNPAQVIIAFSGQSFDFSKQSFWNLADDTLGKPIEAVDCKEMIDQLLERTRSPTYFWDQLERVLRQQGLPDSKIRAIEGRIAESLQTGNPGEVKERLTEVLQYGEQAAKIAEGLGSFIESISELLA